VPRGGRLLRWQQLGVHVVCCGAVRPCAFSWRFWCLWATSEFEPDIGIN